MHLRSPPSQTVHGARTLAITPAGVAGTLLLAVIVIVFVRLGFWQLDRMAEQRELNAGIAARLVAPPIRDVTALSDTAGLFYRAITISGEYDSDRSIILPGRSRRGLPGVYLVTPLLLAGRTDAVLVNRGWVPSPDAATIDVADFAVHGPVSVHGLVLPFPGRAESLSPMEPPPAPTSGGDGFRRVWYAVDEAALRAQYAYPLLPALVQELPSTAAAGSAALASARYPARLDPPPLDAGPHLGYALQWFSFAVIGIIGWIALVLRTRAPRPGPPAAVAALLLLGMAAPGRAQLRPLEPLEWRIFDAGVVLVADVGGGILWDQPATLAGSSGRLLEIGTYNLALRSSRIAIELRGTALWHLREDRRLRDPVEGVDPAENGVRREPGLALAATALRLTPDDWPADVVVRFGATIPTTSDESRLERDRTDFFALVGARYRRGPLSLRMENGVGINGTHSREYPQSDVWTYAFGAAYAAGPLRASADVVGRQDGHSWIVRGNEDMRELRVGFDAGERRWVGVRYILGLSGVSPEHGLRLKAGFLIGR
jgi:surfeit locus 1 family protein